ncbi:MAG: hypothetical protein H0U17_03810 [Actinobacteria bacterium]|nr:hypothetical protein [Actinomycetota bacterium]
MPVCTREPGRTTRFSCDHRRRPTSKTYSQIAHRTDMLYVGDELHHYGWQICSSACHAENRRNRNDPAQDLVRRPVVDPVRRLRTSRERSVTT